MLETTHKAADKRFTLFYFSVFHFTCATSFTGLFVCLQLNNEMACQTANGRVFPKQKLDRYNAMWTDWQ